MRPDLEIIADLVNPGARVLDLGCGEGDLLAHLQADKQVNGYGLEIDPRYLDVSVARWQTLTGQQAIHADTGLTFTELTEQRLSEATQREA